ncbi:MAG: ATP-binding protein [Scytonema sp. PMC 1070.18]|nr:ATP-binding protein [Scytonema sp. PMC 1070.18]
MPNFPTVDCEIPETLNPLNLRHYFLLIYWIYFRPTALKCYLYQADPELYRTGSRLSILRTLFIPTYRNLYFMALGVSVLFFVLVWLSFSVFNFIYEISFSYNLCKIRQSLQESLRELQELLQESQDNFKVQESQDNLKCVLSPQKYWLVLLTSVLKVASPSLMGMTFALVFSLGGGVVRGLYCVASGVVRGVTFSVVFSLAFSTAFILFDAVDNKGLFSAAFGLTFGLAFSAVGGVGSLMAVDVAFIMLIGLLGVSNKVAFGVGFVAGTLRVIFYLFEVGLALTSIYRNKKHPIEWDELIVLPLPGRQRLLARRLQQDELKGLRFASDVACNPFQRWIVQRSLHTHLHNHATPLHFLYGLLSNPELNTYISVPVSKKDWEKLPTSRYLLLGEISGKWVNCRTGWANQLADRFVWSLTWFFRKQRQTPLTVFASMLYQLLDKETVSAKNFSLSNYRKAYKNVASYPGGQEITKSFEALAVFLNYDNLLSLRAAVESASELTPNNTSIRPTVLAAIARLGEVGAAIAISQTGNDRVKQISALHRDINTLDKLDKYVMSEVAMPEQKLLRQIIHRWRSLLMEASGNQDLSRSFPNYRGQIPQCLNPLNVRHYFLLAYWVYFRPTALNCHLYRANSDLYQSRGFGKIFRTWRIPAYRNLYWMAMCVLALFSVLVVVLVVPDTLLSHSSEVNAVAVIPNSRMAVSASSDGTVRMWDLDRKPPLSILPKNFSAFISASFDSTSKKPNNSLWQERLIWQSGAQGVTAVAVTPDKQYAITALTDTTSFDYDFWGIVPYLEKVFNVRIQNRRSNSSNKVQIVGNGTLKVWKLKNGEEVFTLEGHKEKVNAVAVTLDSSKAISASSDKTLKVWDINSGKELRTLKGHNAAVNAVVITPDGSKLISASSDKTLKVWDINSGKELGTLRGHSAAVNAVVIAPDGSKAVSASADKTLKVWDINSGKELHTLEGHSEAVNAVVIALDSSKAISASDDKTIKVWGLNSNKLLYSLKGHTGEVGVIAVTSDGKRAISFIVGGIVPRFWDLEKGVELKRENDLLGRLGLVKLEYLLIGIMVISGILSVPLVLAVSVTTFGVGGGVLGGVISIIILGYASPVQYLLAPLIGVLPQPIYTLVWILLWEGLIPYGMAGGVASRKAFGIVGSVAIFNTILMIVYSISADVMPIPDTNLDLVKRVVVGVVGSVVVAIMGGVWVGVVSIASASRLIFHPLYYILALRSKFGKGKHPVEWDEMVVLPLPGTQRIITQRLQQNELNGLRLVADVASNPFQRAFVQQAMHTYLHQQVAPLRFLYNLLTNPDWRTYIYAPVKKQDWEKFPTTGQLLLGELGGQWVHCSSGWAERLVWKLTQFLRNHRQTPLTRFAAMLYQLLDQKTVEAENFDLSSYRRVYAELTRYPDGEEIAQSFEALVDFLAYNELSDLAQAVDTVSELAPTDTAVRPAVLAALANMGAVGLEVATYEAATSRVNKLAALARATKILDDLDDYIFAEVVTPEKALLQSIIRQWRPLLTEASGKIGFADVSGPVANPYVVGNPVIGHLFIGREDILRRLEELWMVREQCPSVVIYGHRRMGKSSILRNLSVRLGAQTIIVDFNMQRVGLVRNTEELLYNLALSLYDSLPKPVNEQLPEPEECRFLTQNPYTAFDRFLKQLNEVRAEKRFIVAIDEFELIEQLIEENRLEPRLLDFWRGLIQTYSWFVMAFAGLHTLEEMTRNYWNPLFGSVMAIPVSFLSPKAATNLIVQPSPDFDIDYHQDAVEQIIKLTNGQPYLIQLVGHTLVTRFNRQTFEEGIERERRFTVADVDAIINTPEFYRDGNAYFNGVWVQAENSEPREQIAVLKVLSDTSLSLTDIVNQTNLALSQAQAALETLQRHDVIKQENGQYAYTVELMRRWVAQRRGE